MLTSDVFFHLEPYIQSFQLFKGQQFHYELRCKSQARGSRRGHRKVEKRLHSVNLVVQALANGLAESQAAVGLRDGSGESEAKIEDPPHGVLLAKAASRSAQATQKPVRPKSEKDSLLKALSERSWKEAYQESRLMAAEDFKQLEGWSKHNDLMSLVAKGGNLQATWDVYEQLLGSRLSYTALSNILTTCIQNEDLVRGFEVFRDMQDRGMKPNIKTWCYLINSLGKSSRKKGWPYAKRAYFLWKELEQNEDVQTDIDASYYATGIMACTRQGKMQEAETLVESMLQSNVTMPDARVFNMLIKGYSGVNDLAGMDRVIDRMRDMDLKPSATTYNTLIDSYATRDMMQKAHGAVETAIKEGFKPDVWAFSSLIKGYVKAGNMQQVDAVLDNMKAAKVQPNVVTMTNLLDGCVKAGMMSEAESLMQSMRLAKLQPNIRSYNSLLAGHAASGDLKAIEDVFMRMAEDGIAPREDTYNTMMSAALNLGNVKEVPALFEQLVKTSLRPTSLSYTSLISAFGRMRDSFEATAAFSEMKENIGVDRIALNAFISALANANRLEEAEAQLQRAANLAYNQGKPPPVEAYGALVKAYARRRDAEAAIDCFNEFQSKGGEPDDALLDTVVTACVRAGEFKRALQFVRSMESAGQTMDKARLKQTLEVVLRLQEQAAREKKRSSGRNENLERFKFWLGLPNTYYNDDGELRQR